MWSCQRGPLLEAGYNAWRLTSLAPWPPWAIALFVAAAVLAVALAWRGLAGEPRRGRRAALVALRAASALLALFLLLEPALRLLQTSRVKSRLAILVDGSRSMRFPIEPGGPTRAAAVADFVRRHRAELERLGDRVTLEWHAFDRELSPADPGALARGAPASGGRTDLLGALKAASGGGSGRKLAGAVVLSDGADNTALAEGLTPAARAELRALGVPVTAVAVGSAAPKDLAVERVAVDDFAFVRNTVTVEVTLTARGFGREEVPVVLRREGAVVAHGTVRLEPGKERYTLPLSFAPDTTGTFVFTVAAPVYPGEAVAENNARSFVLRVIRDRVRVLLVAGRPSWDERFLRTLLKQDPNVDLISFFILRTASDQPGSQEDLSLIPFPVTEIFGDQLRTFDAVVFVNFAYQPYRSLDIERFLPALRDYVTRGGGFAMIGGEQGFGEAHYGQTALADVLPVEAAEGLGITETAVKPHLTAEGRRHPVTSLVAGEVANEGAWAALPALPDLNRTRPLPPESGARVLLDAPAAPVEGRAAPLVAVREVGSGRALAVATDSSWYWGFVAAEESGSSRAYQRFWNNALRWLVRDPALTPVQVEPDRPAVEPGEPVGLSVSVRTPDYGPGAGLPVHGELVGEDGKTVARGDAVAGADGTARLELVPPGPGAYKVIASARPRCRQEPCPPDAPVETATGAVAVRASGPEDADAAPRPELLRAMAEATGGAFSTADRGLPPVHLAEADVVEVGRRKDVPIWDRAWFLAALVASLGVEWVLRRRWGYW
ncbi:MAG TPA: glutamine amidotransferase [Anaeromyxobacteraceae bacterium]|nr:glutamine amidotransferase [Anaeromyxobacteraceae bacterium]